MCHQWKLAQGVNESNESHDAIAAARIFTIENLTKEKTLFKVIKKQCCSFAQTLAETWIDENPCAAAPHVYVVVVVSNAETFGE